MNFYLCENNDHEGLDRPKDPEFGLVYSQIEILIPSKLENWFTLKSPKDV